MNRRELIKAGLAALLPWKALFGRQELPLTPIEAPAPKPVKPFRWSGNSEMVGCFTAEDYDSWADPDNWEGGKPPKGDGKETVVFPAGTPCSASLPPDSSFKAVVVEEGASVGLAPLQATFSTLRP